MGLYRLRVDDGKLESGIMERVISENIDFEKDFENWLENSPSVLFDDDDKSTVLWIGRQATATVGDINKYPDLLGIDAIVSTALLKHYQGGNQDLYYLVEKGKYRLYNPEGWQMEH